MYPKQPNISGAGAAGGTERRKEKKKEVINHEEGGKDVCIRSDICCDGEDIPYIYRCGI